MKFLDGTLSLIGGFVGLVAFGVAYSNHTLDLFSGLLFGALILLGVIATWRKITGRNDQYEKPRGPLSGKKD